VSRITSAQWVLISGLLALLTLTVGGVLSYQTRAFALESFQVSSLQSSYTNPIGYLIPAIGTLISQMMLIVVAIRLSRWFYGEFSGSFTRRSLIAGVLLATSLSLMSVNSVHDILDTKNGYVHAVLAHIAFGLMILSNIMFIQLAMLWQEEHQPEIRRRLFIDLRWTTFAFVAVLVLFIIPKFTGFDVAAVVFGFNVDYVLGLCEVVYLTVFYATMYRVAATRH
jgi:hypothetical protein